MRSESMQAVLDTMVLRYGESYGRVRFMWLCQKYDVMPWDERPDAMWYEVMGKTRATA